MYQIFQKKKNPDAPRLLFVLRIASSSLSREIPSLCSNNKRQDDASRASVWFSNRGEESNILPISLSVHFFEPVRLLWVQCNLDLVALLVSAKTVTKSHNVTKSNDFM